MSSQLSRIMGALAPQKTKKPTRKKKPNPTFVGQLPRRKPHSMSEMQWQQLQAMHRQFEDRRRQIYAEKQNASKAYRAHMVRSAVKIQRWWWMWRFRKWLPKRRKYREWVRTNNFLPVMAEFKFPFRQDPLLLGRHLPGVHIDKLAFT